MMTDLIFLSEMNSPEVQKIIEEGRVILIPVGSTEQHGPHLPLDTDIVNVVEIAKRVAKKTGAIITPPVYFGISWHHIKYPGTITLRTSTFINLLTDICMSLVHHGFKKIVILNGHGGNREAIGLVAKRVVLMSKVRKKRPVIIAAFSYWEVAREEINKLRTSELGGICHACELETSLQLVFRPELVKLENAVKFIPKPYSKIFGVADLVNPEGLPLTIAVAVDEDRGVGIYGDPTVASREKGEKFLEVIVENVVKVVLELQKLRL